MKILIVVLLLIAHDTTPGDGYLYQSRNAFDGFPGGSIEVFTWGDLDQATDILISPVDLQGKQLEAYDTLRITGVQYYNYGDTVAKFKYYCIRKPELEVPQWYQYSINRIDTAYTQGSFVYDRRFYIELN
jgi:hypothetical protein